MKAGSQPGPNACGLQFLVYKEGGFIARNTKGFMQDKGLLRTEPVPGFPYMYTPACFFHTCVCLPIIATLGPFTTSAGGTRA